MVSQPAPEANRTRTTTSPDPNGPSTPIPLNKPTPSEPWSVEAALSSLPTPPPSHPPPTTPLPFFHLLERLKTTKRAGWLRFPIPSVESISDHMYRMSILTMLAPPALSSRLNIPHCTKMALVHDMAEALVGDITPLDAVPKEEKSRRESSTIDYMTATLLGGVGGGAPGEAIRAVWREYEEGATLEARFVHDVDKVELLLQMVEYERLGEGRLDLGEFLSVAQRVELGEMKGWCREVLREREEFWKGVGVRPARADVAEMLLSRTA